MSQPTHTISVGETAEYHIGDQCVYILHPDGTESWLNEGNLHRTDGPAIIYADGTKKWISDGKTTKIEFPNGSTLQYTASENGENHDKQI